MCIVFFGFGPPPPQTLIFSTAYPISAAGLQGEQPLVMGGATHHTQTPIHHTQTPTHHAQHTHGWVGGCS